MLLLCSQTALNYETNFVPFYNQMVCNGLGNTDIRKSSFLIQSLYVFDTIYDSLQLQGIKNPGR